MPHAFHLMQCISTYLLHLSSSCQVICTYFNMFSLLSDILKVAQFIIIICLSLINQFKCDIAPSPLFNLDPTLPHSGEPHHNDHNGTTTSRIDSSAELVLGTFAEEIENAWFYETYYPVLLKLPVPTWTIESIRLNKSAPRCSPLEVNTNYQCTTQFYMDNLIFRTTQFNRFFRNLYTANEFGSNVVEDDIFEKDIHCQRIRPHFHQFATNLEGVEPYVKELQEKCLLAKNIQLIEKYVGITEKTQDVTRKAHERFAELHRKQLIKLEALQKANIENIKKDNLKKDEHEDSHFNDVHEPSSSTQAPPPTNHTGTTSTKKFNFNDAVTLWRHLEMTSNVVFQNALTMLNFADSVRWVNAFTTCQASRLDISLVPPEILTELLQEAAQNLTQLGPGFAYNISIPFDKLLTHYYKLPLTDCVLAIESAIEGHLILRLLLPVTQLFRHYKLVKLSKVPFFIRSPKNDTIKAGSICEIKNYQYDDSFIVEYDTSTSLASEPYITSVIKAPATCGPYHVCRIPEFAHRNLVNPCVEGIITKNEDMTKEKCEFRCFPLLKKQAERELPYIIQLKSNKYAVVGASIDETKENVTVKCFGRIKIASIVQDKGDEATIVTLPCSCEIFYEGKSYFPTQPCNGTLEIIHVTHVFGDEDGNETDWKTLDDGEKLIETNPHEPHHSGKFNHGNHANNNKKSSKNGTSISNDTNLLDLSYLSSEEQEYLDSDDVFHLPESNEKDKAESEEFSQQLGVVDASKWSCSVATHVVVWVIASIMFVSNVFILYTLYQKQYFTLDSILAW